MPPEEGIRAYVSQRIKEIRTGFGETGISQEALADKLGVAPNTISRWETGTYEPTLNDLEALSRELSVSILDCWSHMRLEICRETAVPENAPELLPFTNEGEFARPRISTGYTEIWASLSASMVRS